MNKIVRADFSIKDIFMSAFTAFLTPTPQMIEPIKMPKDIKVKSRSNK